MLVVDSYGNLITVSSQSVECDKTYPGPNFQLYQVNFRFRTLCCNCVQKQTVATVALFKNLIFLLITKEGCDVTSCESWHTGPVTAEFLVFLSKYGNTEILVLWQGFVWYGVCT